jgi:hypothetical protein
MYYNSKTSLIHMSLYVYANKYCEQIQCTNMNKKHNLFFVFFNGMTFTFVNFRFGMLKRRFFSKKYLWHTRNNRHRRTATVLNSYLLMNVRGSNDRRHNILYNTIRYWTLFWLYLLTYEIFYFYRFVITTNIFRKTLFSWIWNKNKKCWHLKILIT